MSKAASISIGFVAIAIVASLFAADFMKKRAERGEIQRFLASSHAFRLHVPILPDDQTITIDDPESIATIRSSIHLGSGRRQPPQVTYANAGCSIDVTGDGEPQIRLRVTSHSVFSFRDERDTESNWIWSCDGGAFQKLTEIGRIDWESLASGNSE
jgi:hypothetical protein